MSSKSHCDSDSQASGSSDLWRRVQVLELFLHLGLLIGWGASFSIVRSQVRPVPKPGRSSLKVYQKRFTNRLAIMSTTLP